MAMCAKCLLLVGMGLAAFADFGTGLLSASLLVKFFHKQPMVWHYIIGMGAAVMPDIDLLFATLVKRESGTAHHDYGHYPVLIIPFGILLYVASSFFWMLLVCLPFLLHYVHDSIGGAVGRMWLWPFSRVNYQLFVMTEHGFVFARPHYRDQRNRVQNLSLHEWVQEHCFTLNKEFFIEVCWFLFAVVIFFLA